MQLKSAGYKIACLTEGNLAGAEVHHSVWCAEQPGIAIEHIMMNSKDGSLRLIFSTWETKLTRPIAANSFSSIASRLSASTIGLVQPHCRVHQDTTPSLPRRANCGLYGCISAYRTNDGQIAVQSYFR